MKTHVPFFCFSNREYFKTMSMRVCYFWTQYKNSLISYENNTKIQLLFCQLKQNEYFCGV
jgi:hypothetical protein